MCWASSQGRVSVTMEVVAAWARAVPAMAARRARR